MVVKLLTHIILFTLLLRLLAVAASQKLPIAKPNRQSHCGDIEIPYPFGIGEGCYINDTWFQIICDNSTGSPKPFLNRTNLEVLQISVVGTLKVSNPVTFFNCSKKSIDRKPANLEGSPFVYSKENMFTVGGCGVMATISSNSNGYTISSGCKSKCDILVDKGTVMNYGLCKGIGCCQTAIPSFLSAFNTSFQFRENNTESSCKYAFLVDNDWFQRNVNASAVTASISKMDTVPVVLDWNLHHSSYDLFGFGTYATETYSGRRFCQNYRYFFANSTSLQCYCGKGYAGNPYLLDGCQDINECENRIPACSAYYLCENFPGGFGCSPTESNSNVNVIFIGTGTGLGLLFLIVGARWLHKAVKKRKAIKRKEKFFKQNGGILLQQQLASGEVNVEKIKLFHSKELEKATYHFSVDRILGQGGQGTVYKGMLMDGRLVAVKKSTNNVSKGKVKQFVNEIVILSQINHRNVVKLLGCCLETEVPLLIYEYIPNGTLSQYIHEQNEEFPLTWEMRLRIAREVAGALSYLHSAASVPIYHRDIKSTNILLDDKYRARVADFGTSRSVSIEQTHLTTNVQGTFGYLDPEYFQSSKFTDKSDVYSFGVVLVELLTGQKAVSLTSSGEARGLVAYFKHFMDENSVFDIFDARVKEDGAPEEILAVANLAKRCLDMDGKRRPAMREVAMELEGVRKACNVQLNCEEVDHVGNVVIGPWDAASTSTTDSTGLALESRSASQTDVLSEE